MSSGRPEQATTAVSVADSLSPPFTLPYSLGLVRGFVDDIVAVSEEQLLEAVYEGTQL